MKVYQEFILNVEKDLIENLINLFRDTKDNLKKYIILG